VPTRQRSREVPETLAFVLLAAVSLRLLGAGIAGAITTVQSRDFPEGRGRAANILNAFGSTGDTVSVLLVLAAAGLVGWGRPRPRADVLRPIVRVLLLMVAVVVLARLVAVFLIDVDLPAQAAGEEASLTAIGVADLLLCAGGLVVLRRADAIEDAMSDDVEPLVFAVDRGNGEVFAFFSYAEAVRTISVYSIEEDEFAFYADDGTVLNAAVIDGRTTFTPTDVDAREELMQQLQRFAQAKALDVADPSDPTSYAVPVADWQWLELWPGWLRGIGRLFRRLRG
jgi:hypothetical protein